MVCCGGPRLGESGSTDLLLGMTRDVLLRVDVRSHDPEHILYRTGQAIYSRLDYQVSW